MATRKVSALLLDSSAAAGVEPVTFAGFPGRFVPGEPVEVEALAGAAGIEASALLALLDELELPLEVVQIKHGTGPLPVAENHVGGSETFELDEADADGDPSEEHEEPAADADEPATEEGDV